MNENLKDKLSEILKQEAEGIMHSDNGLIEKLKQMDDISNMIKVIDNFEELEPTLKKFFKEKAEKDKWDEGR